MNESLPLVSIIIPCYNGEVCVKEAIQSALDQTYPKCEVIVIDDGSTDSSPDFIRSFGSNIQILEQENRGAPAARNLGLKKAKGEFIQFLDVDDVLYKEKIFRQIDYIKTHNDGLVFCCYKVVTLDGTSKEINFDGNKDFDSVCAVLQGDIQTSSPLYKREQLLDIGGFDETLPCAQEYDLNMRLSCSGIEYINMPEVLFKVRKRSGSISDDYPRVLKQIERILTPRYKELEDRNDLSENRRRSFAERMCYYASVALRLGEKNLARKYYDVAAEFHNGRGFTQYSRPVRLLHEVTGGYTARSFMLIGRRLIR